MSRKEVQYYNAWAGLDTRSNALKQPPDSVRRGSQNFRYDFQDQLTKSNGSQHKAATIASPTIDFVEYKYRDINTGESKTEILSVSQDGNLYRKKANYIKFTSLGNVTAYEFHYNEVSTNWDLILTQAGIPITISFDTTYTMDQLRLAINAATTATTVVVDDAGSTVTGSTRVAYLMDVIGTTSLDADIIQTMSSWFWEVVESPDTLLGTEPFPTTRDFYNTDEYEGVSYINLNNVCYITDGGFPMKYDGYQVYRMGIQETLRNRGLFSAVDVYRNFSGQEVFPFTSRGGQLTNGIYKYIIQSGFVDSNGAETVGGIEDGEFGAVQDTLSGANNSSSIASGKFIGENFPVWACVVNGDQNLGPSGGTITVSSGHNIKVGMLLRIPIRNTISGDLDEVGFSYIMSYVSAVGATSITVDFGAPALTGYYYPVQKDEYVSNGTYTSGSAVVTGISNTANISPGDYVISIRANYGTKVLTVDSPTQITMTANAISSGTSGTSFIQYGTLMISGQILNAGYASDFYKNKITDIDVDAVMAPEIHFGAFTRIWRTEVGGDVFYHVMDIPVGRGGSNYTTYDLIGDDHLGRAFLDSPQGADLPRACKYLAVWQNQVIQAGRPVDPTIADDYYPGAIGPVTNTWTSEATTYTGWLYGENSLCDFQSYYWNDVLNPEGFPQSGLYENTVDSVFNDRIKGLGVNKDALFAFKDRTTAIITGNLAVGDLVQEIFEEDIGCANHKTIQSVDGALVWLDAINGFYACVAGRLPTPISYSINDEFKRNPDSLDFSKSWAQNYEKENLYFCVVDSKMFVYDYAKTSNNSNRSGWYKWDSLSAKSLLSTANDQLLLSDGSRTWKMKFTNTKYDFSNHQTAIDFRYIMAWQTYGHPVIDKHFIQTWINSIQGGFDLTVTQYVNFNETSVGEYTLSFPTQTTSQLPIKKYFKASYPKCSSYSLMFSNTANQAYVRVQGWEITLDAEYDLTEPKQ